jgi:hypothetical protein
MTKTVDHEISMLEEEKKALVQKIKAIDLKLRAKYLI